MKIGKVRLELEGIEIDRIIRALESYYNNTRIRQFRELKEKIENELE